MYFQAFFSNFYVFNFFLGSYLKAIQRDTSNKSGLLRNEKISTKTYVVGTQKNRLNETVLLNRLNETVLLSTQNIC